MHYERIGAAEDSCANRSTPNPLVRTLALFGAPHAVWSDVRGVVLRTIQDLLHRPS